MGRVGIEPTTLGLKVLGLHVLIFGLKTRIAAVSEQPILSAQTDEDGLLPNVKMLPGENIGSAGLISKTATEGGAGSPRRVSG
jgi:hypothetical protein